MIVFETERSLQKEADGNRQRGAEAVELRFLVQSGLRGAACYRQGNPAAVLGLSCPTPAQARRVSFEDLLLAADHGLAGQCAEGL